MNFSWLKHFLIGLALFLAGYFSFGSVELFKEKPKAVAAHQSFAILTTATHL
jgi:hypothetical protein